MPTATASSTATSSRRTSSSTTARPRCRLRHRPGRQQCRRLPDDRDRDVAGHPALHEPRAGDGEREITARSDVYALGAMTYEMLLGEPPFSGPTAQAIVAKVLTEAPRPLTPRRHSIPPEVEDAVLTALESFRPTGSAPRPSLRSPYTMEPGTPEDCRLAPAESRRLLAAMAFGPGPGRPPTRGLSPGRESGVPSRSPDVGPVIKVTWILPSRRCPRCRRTDGASPLRAERLPTCGVRALLAEARPGTDR